MFPSDRERESQYDILLALGIINLKFLNVLKLRRWDVGAGAEKMFCIEAGTSELSQFLLISPDIIHENKLAPHSRPKMHNWVFLRKQSCEGQ